MAVGPGAESVRIELYAPAPTASRWDEAQWDGGRWSTPVWNAIGCDVMEAQYTYGATDEAGVLSLPTAGQLDLSTRDTGRELDPGNADGPWFGSIAPGTPIRIATTPAAGGLPAWTGYLDEATFDVETSRGKLRAIDGIAYLAQADLPAGLSLPNTLRARIRAVITAAGVGNAVAFETDPPATLQLVANPGFESGTSGWAASAGTFYTEPHADSPAGPTPNGSQARATLKTDATIGYPGFTSARVPVVPGATYTLAGWAGQFPNPTARVRFLRVHWLRADGSALADGTDIQWSAAEITWSYKSAAMVAPAGAAYAELFAFIADASVPANTSFALWDDLTLTGPNPSTPEADPPVALYDGKERTAWAAILDAAQDALAFVWLDAAGVLHTLSWGSFPPAAFAIGCGPEDEGPWVEGLRTVVYGSNADAIRNGVRAWSAPSVATAVVRDSPSVSKYGLRTFAVDRVVPDFANWSARILADRAGLSVGLGEVRPYDTADLGRLLSLTITGPAILRVRDEDHPPLIDQTAGAIGGRVRVTASGWSFGLVTMVPRVEWDAVEPPPVEPPIPPPDPWHTETRTYIAVDDALVALTSGGAKYGAGAASSLPVGKWSGWSYRSAMHFPAIPWTKVRAVKTATLQLTTSTQDRVGFGSSPTVEVRRVTSSWSAGSASSPSGSNAVVWPGPTTTTTGSVRANVTRSQGAAVAIRCDAIVRAWAPSAAGGSAAAQRGIELLEGSGSEADTSEFWPVEKGGSSRPTLVLVLEVFD